MPIENERKYVILETEAVERRFAEIAQTVIPIRQRYLVTEKRMSARVRCSNYKEGPEYVFTFKKNINSEVIEIETEITEDDFNMMWPAATNGVEKTRYIYEGWEVDFFKHDDFNYLAVAEIELPPKKKQPSIIPQLVIENLIYVVPIEDKRFSNKKLGDIQYAVSLLDSLKVKSNLLNKGGILKRKYH